MSEFVVSEEPVVEPVVIEEPVVVPEPIEIKVQSEPINIPITNTVTYNVTSYVVEDCVNIILNVKAIIYVLFYTDSNVTFRRTVTLTGADYDAWTNDDNYIYEYVKTNVMAIFNSEPI